MGFYIEVGSRKNKAALIAERFPNAVDVAAPKWSDVPAGKGLIVVVDNGPFEAAGFLFDEQEFNRAQPRDGDDRPRTYILLDREDAEEASGYAAEMKRRAKEQEAGRL